MAYIGRDIEYGVLEKQSLTADGTSTDFTLNYGVGSSTALIVSVGGIVQEPDVGYTTSGSTISFATAPATGDGVFVVFIERELITTTAQGSDWVAHEMETGDGTTTQFTLSYSTTQAQDLAISLNGINQTPGTDFTVSGTTLTFSTAPANGLQILIYHLAVDMGAGNLADGSVTNPKIVSMDASKLTGSMPSEIQAGSFAAQYQDLSTLALHWASVDNKVAMNLTDDFIDHFQDDSGWMPDDSVAAQAAEAWDYSVTGQNVLVDRVSGGVATGSSSGLDVHGTGMMYQAGAPDYWKNLSDASNQPSSGGQAFYWNISGNQNFDTGFQTDFGSAVQWESFAFGKANSHGDIKTVRIRHSLDGSNWTILDVTNASADTGSGNATSSTNTVTMGANGVMTFNEYEPTDRFWVHTVTGFTSFTARYIRLEIGEVYSGQANNNCGWRHWVWYKKAVAGTASTGSENVHRASGEYIASGSQTTDSNTKLLIHSDTTDGSTAFVDSSGTHTIGVVGNLQHSTAQSKFGGSSIAFDGSGDELHIPHHSDFDFGSNDFTVEYWIRTNGSGNSFAWALCHKGVHGSSGMNWWLGNNGSQLSINVFTSGGTVNIRGGTHLADAQWHHVALVRNGNVWTSYADGVQEATQTLAGSMNATTNDFIFGKFIAQGSGDFNGHMDEIRISDTARYTANFTPSSTKYEITSTTTTATGSLLSTTSTADSTVSKATGVMLYKDGEGTNTIGTDLKAYFSADNGSNWTEAASYGSPTTFDGTTNVIPLGKTTLSNTGTAVKMKAEWANQQASSKIAQLHGWAVNY